MPVLRGDAVEKRPAVPAEMTGLYTTEALKFIDANRDRPFFLYLGHAMPHIPFDASPALQGQVRARPVRRCRRRARRQHRAHPRRSCASCGLAEKTLVIFTSDNGPERKTPGTAAPLTGTKHTVYEGGLRVPCIAWWPGHVPAGRVCDEFISALDMLPTLAHLSGAGLPETRPRWLRCQRRSPRCKGRTLAAHDPLLPLRPQEESAGVHAIRPVEAAPSQSARTLRPSR